MAHRILTFGSFLFIHLSIIPRYHLSVMLFDHADCIANRVELQPLINRSIADLIECGIGWCVDFAVFMRSCAIQMVFQ